MIIFINASQSKWKFYKKQTNMLCFNSGGVKHWKSRDTNRVIVDLRYCRKIMVVVVLFLSVTEFHWVHICLFGCEPCRAVKRICCHTREARGEHNCRLGEVFTYILYLFTNCGFSENLLFHNALCHTNSKELHFKSDISEIFNCFLSVHSFFVPLQWIRLDFTRWKQRQKK